MAGETRGAPHNAPLILVSPQHNFASGAPTSTPLLVVHPQHTFATGAPKAYLCSWCTRQRAFASGAPTTHLHSLVHPKGTFLAVHGQRHLDPLLTRTPLRAAPSQSRLADGRVTVMLKTVQLCVCAMWWAVSQVLHQGSTGPRAHGSAQRIQDLPGPEAEGQSRNPIPSQPLRTLSTITCILFSTE